MFGKFSFSGVKLFENLNQSFTFIQILFAFQINPVLKNVTWCFLTFIVIVYLSQKKQTRKNIQKNTQTPGIPAQQLSNSKLSLYKSPASTREKT